MDNPQYIHFSSNISFEPDTNRNIIDIEINAQFLSDNGNCDTFATVKLKKIVSIICHPQELFEQMDATSDELLRCFENCIEDDFGMGRFIGDDDAEFSGMIYIQEIKVDDDYKRYGLGKAIVQEVIRLIGDFSDVLTVIPYPIDAKRNKEAHSKVISFWESLGFKQLGSTEFWHMPCHVLKDMGDFIDKVKYDERELHKFEEVEYKETKEEKESFERMRKALEKTTSFLNDTK